MRVLVTATALLLLGACSSNSTPDQVSDTIACTDPRPQVCTMEYNPACANLRGGDTRQYASGCNACADDAVASYVSGPCSVEE